VEHWNNEGSGWNVEKIELFYVKTARYDPLGVGSYLPLPENLAKKKAIPPYTLQKMGKTRKDQANIRSTTG